VTTKSPGEAAKTIAENFIDAHGRPRFLRLIEMFRNNEPGPKIAFEFKVSRQRVHQWKCHLGQERVTFIPWPEIEPFIGVGGVGRRAV